MSWSCLSISLYILLYLRVKIFNFLHNFPRKNQQWNKYENLGITPQGHKKSEKKFI